MQYKLIENSLNDIFQARKTIFNNRQFDYKLYKEKIKTNNLNYYNPDELFNMDKAVKCYLKHISGKHNITILVDDDVDGMTSAAMVYLYTQKIQPDCKIQYILHKEEKHGLSDYITIPEDTDLLIIPDAGSNDIEQCEKYFNQGIDIIVLDHHNIEKVNPYAIIVNSKDGYYPNQDLSGAGVVYKFLQAIDFEEWTNYADDYLDLTALGIISDNMAVNVLENRLIIDKGLSKINNKLFSALIKSQEYSLQNNCYGIDIQFYITPLINALIRVGKQDEKELLFNAFIENYQVFPYKKRGQTEVVDEDIYTRVARIAKNCHSRQKRMVDKYIDTIISNIKDNNLDKNEIIFANVSGLFKQHLTGLIAAKLADYYKKPCLLLHLTNDKQYLIGSGRNYNYSKVDNLQEELLSTNEFEFVSGHNNAFGAKINKDNIKNVIENTNNKLKKIEKQHCDLVDFIIDEEELSLSLIKDVYDMNPFLGVKFEPIKIAVENIIVNLNNVNIIGKNFDTLKFQNDEGIEFIKFKIAEDDALYNCMLECDSESDNKVKINAICKVGFNTYNGLMIPQAIIENYEIINN